MYVKPYKAAVIGTGWAGKMHALAYMNCIKSELIGVSDISESSGQKMGEELNTFYTTNYHEFFDVGTQVVSIATPRLPTMKLQNPSWNRGFMS